MVGRVARVRKQLEIQQLEVREAQEALALAMDRVVRSERELAALEEDRLRLLGRLRERAGALYRLGRWGYLRMLFSLSSGSEALPGIRLLRAVVRRDADTLAELEENRRRSEEVTAELQRRRAEARSWLDRQRRRSGELEQQRRREREALAALERREAEIREAVARVEGRRAKLDRLLSVLADEGPGGLGGLPIDEFRGALDWPVEGRLVRGFGPYRDAQYGTMVPHNGVLVEPVRVGTVRVVYPGRVVYAGDFRDLGPVAVVQHRERVLTLYSGLSSLEVAEGDLLALGDAVGTGGGEIYFEIRVDSEPEDPRNWLN